MKVKTIDLIPGDIVQIRLTNYEDGKGFKFKTVTEKINTISFYKDNDRILLLSFDSGRQCVESSDTVEVVDFKYSDNPALTRNYTYGLLSKDI